MNNNNNNNNKQIEINMQWLEFIKRCSDSTGSPYNKVCLNIMANALNSYTQYVIEKIEGGDYNGQ